MKQNDIPAFLGSLFQNAASDFGGPLKQEKDSKKPTSYEAINRDSGEDLHFQKREMYMVPLITCISFKPALRMCEAFMASPTRVDSSCKVRPFVYVSAEDIFRPVISVRYIETKREAERGIEKMMTLNPQFRGVYIRPSVFIS